MRHGLDQLELYGDAIFTIGIPEDAPIEFKKHIFAAAKAQLLGEKTEKILREFGHVWTDFENPSPEYKLVREVADFVRNEVTRLRDKLPTDTSNMEFEGQYVGCAALFRLTVTYELTLAALKHGYWLEASTLLKQIVEQIAWAYSIRSASYEMLQSTSPSKSISEWKKVYPIAGNLYGLINTDAHIHPKRTHWYIHAAEKESHVILGSLRYSLLTSWPILLTLDMLGICIELSFPKDIAKLEYTRRAGGRILPNDKRKILKKLERFRVRLEKRFSSSKRSDLIASHNPIEAAFSRHRSKREAEKLFPPMARRAK